jgi:hypothetical protein
MGLNVAGTWRERRGGGGASGAIMGGGGPIQEGRTPRTWAGLRRKKNEPGPRRIVPSSIYSKCFKKT